MSNNAPETMPKTLDVTTDVCPMTFVKTRLRLDKMQAGEMLRVLLSGSEARLNVPRSVTELGHELISEQLYNDITELMIRKR